MKNTINELEAYYRTYYGKVSVDNAQYAIVDFNEKWQLIMGTPIDSSDDCLSKYGCALIIYSFSVFTYENVELERVKHVESLINNFDDNPNVKNLFNVKSVLFFNLGYCWYKLGSSYHNEAVNVLKKSLYYRITFFSNNSYRPRAYAFRKCNTYLYHSLVNEQLNLSSPVTFNDPFDCPILKVFNTDDGISSLILEAFKNLKVTCFSSNNRLPYMKFFQDSSCQVIKEGKKSKKSPKEFLNTLMWAHYADSHKGICIQYHFSDFLEYMGNNNPGKSVCFSDVKYMTDMKNRFITANSLNFEDAFFIKSMQWKYENELRLLYYDIDDCCEHGSLSIPNSIEAIYFGLNCSERDRKAILQIMRCKKFVLKDICGKLLQESPVQFFNIVRDDKHFGKLKAIKL